MNLKQKLLGIGATVTAFATQVSAAYTGDYTFSDLSALTGDFVGNLLVGMISEADSLGQLTIVAAVLILVLLIITAIMLIAPTVIREVRKIKTK